MKSLQLCPKACKRATQKNQQAEDLQSGPPLFTQNKVHKYRKSFFLKKNKIKKNPHVLKYKLIFQGEQRANS